MAKQDKAETVENNEASQRARFDLNSLNTLSVVSLATAVTGFGAVAAVITGHIALAQLKTDNRSGRGLAIAGLVVGYAFVALAIFGGIARAFWGPRYGFEPVGPMVGGHDDMWRGGMGMDQDGDHGMGWMMTPGQPTDAPTPETGSTVN